MLRSYANATYFFPQEWAPEQIVEYIHAREIPEMCAEIQWTSPARYQTFFDLVQNYNGRKWPIVVECRIDKQSRGYHQCCFGALNPAPENRCTHAASWVSTLEDKDLEVEGMGLLCFCNEHKESVILVPPRGFRSLLP